MYQNAGNSRKGRGTFIVKVEHCDNESWQGEVVWADEEKREKFRSALELLKLMDDAIKPASEQDGTVWKQETS